MIKIQAWSNTKDKREDKSGVALRTAARIENGESVKV